MQKTVAFMAAALFSTALFAGDDSKKSANFESLDRNADQQISQTEAQTDKMLSESFASADANGDGYLSKSEFQTKHKSGTPRS